MGNETSLMLLRLTREGGILSLKETERRSPLHDIFSFRHSQLHFGARLDPCMFLFTARFSEMYFLALAIGSACGLMIIIVIGVVLFQHFRKKRWAEEANKVVEIHS